ncbi:MAG: cytochrome c biogenesis protein ResB, partial [Deltaproteobacteria bacterium]|nr:cytochrome c biogenesis protein ResB [Deltaproteobacteria bacterium]
ASVEEALRRSFGTPRRSADDHGTVWFVQKHAWGRLGAYVCHLSLVLFFLGGIVGARYGFKGFVQVPEGASVSQVQLRDGGTMPLSFEVRCDDFELTSYPDGRPKDYLSRLTVSRSGNVLQRKIIEVNDPLIQDGIYFYQSSYGTAGGGALFRVLDRQGNVVAPALQIPNDGSAQVPGTETVVEVLATTEDMQGHGPAAQLSLVDTSGGHRHLGEPFVVAQRYPTLDQRRGADLVFELTALLPGTPYTGLQVAKDPGVPLIWAGCIVLTVGLLMAFFASHQRVWVRLENGKMILAGTASKNKDTFREKVAALEAKLKDLSLSDTVVTRAWPHRRTA